MRLASFLLNGSESFGIVTNEGVYPVQANFKDHTPDLKSVFSEQKTMDSSVRKLKVQVAKKGKLNANQLMAIGIFILVFLGWIFFSPIFGLGTVALSGVFLYLSFGLINWKEINRNTNWGVILLFGYDISLGIQMKETGAAFWVAGQTLTYLEIIFQDVEIVRWFVSVIVTGLLTNLLSSAANVAVL